MSQKSGGLSIRTIHAIIGVCIMLFFRYLPLNLPGVTPMGMEILGIFIGTLYLWTTVDPIWSSMLSIFLIGTSSYAPMAVVLQTAFGNPVLVQILYLLIIMNVLIHNKITAYIGRFFLTLKINQGRPWVFTSMIMLAAMILAAFIGGFAPIFLFWPILYGIFQETGMKRGDPFASLLIILVTMGALIGFPVPSFATNGLALLTNYKTVTENLGSAMAINDAAYMSVSAILGLTFIVGIVLFCKFVFRPDTSKLRDFDIETLKKNPLPPLNKNQIFLVITFIGYVLVMIVPSIIPQYAIMQTLSQNSTGIALGYCAMLCVVNLEKESKEPILPMGPIMAGFPWATYYIVGAAILLGSVLTAEPTGITVFLNTILNPIFGSLSLVAFFIVVLVLALILTNLCNSLVIGMLLQPVIVSFCFANGVNPSPIVALLITFVLTSAAVTPAASPFAAIMHANSDWLDAGPIYKYGSVIVLVELALAIVVGIPLAMLLIK